MKNNTLVKNIRRAFMVAIALAALGIISGTAAHADLTGPKPPNPPKRTAAPTNTVASDTTQANQTVGGAR